MNIKFKSLPHFFRVDYYKGLIKSKSEKKKYFLANFTPKKKIIKNYLKMIF